MAFNNGFRKIFNIDRHTSVRLIINGFNVLLVFLIFVCNLFYMIHNMLKIDKFQRYCSSVFKVRLLL